MTICYKWPMPTCSGQWWVQCCGHQMSGWVGGKQEGGRCTSVPPCQAKLCTGSVSLCDSHPARWEYEKHLRDKAQNTDACFWTLFIIISTLIKKIPRIFWAVIVILGRFFWSSQACFNYHTCQNMMGLIVTSGRCKCCHCHTWQVRHVIVTPVM